MPFLALVLQKNSYSKIWYQKKVTKKVSINLWLFNRVKNVRKMPFLKKRDVDVSP